MDSRTLLRQLIEGSNGRIFTATFVKKDGSVRTMRARLGVKAHRKTADRKPSTANCPEYVCVYDMEKGYRTLNLDTVLHYKCGQVEVTA